jgi:hypothetical protein
MCWPRRRHAADPKHPATTRRIDKMPSYQPAPTRKRSATSEAVVGATATTTTTATAPAPAPAPGAAASNRDNNYNRRVRRDRLYSKMLRDLKSAGFMSE